MLNATQSRYIDWYYQQRSGKSRQEIATAAGVSVRAVDKGLAWCKRQRIGEREDLAELEKRIADCHNDIQRIQRNIRRTERQIRNADELGPKDSPLVGLNNSLIGFYRELREQKTYLAELQGLYKRTVNLNIGDYEGNELKLKLESASDDAGT